MTLETEHSVDHRIELLFFKYGYGKEVAFALTHFAGLVIKMLDMEPVIAPAMTEEGFTLGNFIGMMREDIVYAAAVNIQMLAEILKSNAGALNVPARITYAPGAVPLKSLILKLGLGKPKNKVVFVLFIGVFVHIISYANQKVIFVVSCENIVIIKL